LAVLSNLSRKIHHFVVITGVTVHLGFAQIPDSSCEAYEAWQAQANVRSDALGIRNIAFPEVNGTYWATPLEAPLGTEVLIRGRYPRARYMAFHLYDSERNVVGAINDADINPNPGQNNPFRSGGAQGTYTIRIVFDRQHLLKPPNTIYTGGLTKVLLLYRVYYPDNPNDLAGDAFDPQLPTIIMNGRVLSSCPPRPIITPEDATVWGRLDNGDWAGTVPTEPSPALVRNPPVWNLVVPNRITPFYPSADNSYMYALISREYLRPPHNYDMVVLKFRAPTFTNTQAGEPPYWSNTTRQVRFWSICQYDTISTGAVRCLSDDEAMQRDGFVTLVISDPSKRPSNQVLLQHAASWLPWGALQPGDFVYDINLDVLTNEQPVHYYGTVMYRQTLPNPSFSQSILAVSQLPATQWKSAMGDYWPKIGYCTAAQFNLLGGECIGR
jgi:hypothetical protein